MEKGRKLYSIQMDMSKAFDSVTRWSMRLSLARVGVPEDCINFLEELDKGTSQVLTAFGLTESYNIGKGVRQGEVMSPLKWIVFFDALLDMQKKAVV